MKLIYFLKKILKCKETGRDAMNITLRAGWNALDAVLQKTRTNKANVLLHQVLGTCENK